MAPDICAPYDVKFKGQHAEKGSVAVVCHAMLFDAVLFVYKHLNG